MQHNFLHNIFAETSNIIESLLDQCNRHRMQTPGDGNCFFHAVSMQLKQTSHRFLRKAVAEECVHFMAAMTKYRSAWIRSKRYPKDAKDYPTYISQDGVWANSFDLSLMASFLFNKTKNRLIVLDDRLSVLRVVKKPLLQPLKLCELVGQNKIEPAEVLHNDVVVLLSNNTHFTACVNNS